MLGTIVSFLSKLFTSSSGASIVGGASAGAGAGAAASGAVGAGIGASGSAAAAGGTAAASNAMSSGLLSSILSAPEKAQGAIDKAIDSYWSDNPEVAKLVKKQVNSTIQQATSAKPQKQSRSDRQRPNWSALPSKPTGRAPATRWRLPG